MWSVLQEMTVNKDWDQLLFKYIKLRDMCGIEMSLSEDADINKCDPSGQTPLCFAIRLGNMRIFNYLITNCADVNTVGDNGLSPLSTAGVESHGEMARVLLEKGADINKIDTSGETCLAKAAAYGQQDMVTFFISMGADIFKREGDGKSPVACALMKGHWNIAKLLFSKGATLSEGETAFLLQYAQSTGQVDIVKHMVEASIINIEIVKFLKGTDIDFDKTKENEDTFLATFAAKGNAEMVEYLLESGVNIDKVGKQGTPLIRSVLGGHAQTVKTLLAKGANVNATDADGNTALTYAILNRQTAVFKQLVLEEVDFCKVGKNGTTPLCAAVQIEDLAMIKLLIDAGATPTIQTAFLTAIETGNIEIVKYLTNVGANVNWVYKNGDTPLTKAVNLQYLGVARFLIDHGATIQPSRLSSHLLQSVKSKNFNMLQFLVDAGADVNIVGDCGYTPLTKAVETENFKLVMFLLQQGANVNLVDRNKKSPLAIAASCHYFKICQYLIHYGARIKSARAEVDEYASWNEDFAVFLDVRKRQQKRSRFEILIKKKLLHAIRR